MLFRSLRTKLGVLTPEQQAAIDNLTRSLVNKILHSPISALKNVSGSDQLTTTAELLRSLFDIEDHSARRGGTASITKESSNGLAKMSERTTPSSSSGPRETDVTAQKSTARR